MTCHGLVKKYQILVWFATKVRPDILYSAKEKERAITRTALQNLFNKL